MITSNKNYCKNLISKLFPENQKSFSIHSCNKLKTKIQINETQIIPHGNNFQEIKFVILAIEETDVFIIWDYRIHHGEGVSRMVTLTHKIDEIINPVDTPVFWPYYKTIHETIQPDKEQDVDSKKTKSYEKVYVVDRENMAHFLSNLNFYMKFNEYDINYPLQKSGNTIKESWGVFDEKGTRLKYSSLARKRDYRFRNAVIDLYKKCIVCGCSDQSILQAAHLHGHEVSNNEKADDNPKYGICLCANHHLMYDRGQIEINTDNDRVTIVDSTLNNMEWFGSFPKDYAGNTIMKIGNKI